jgi:hypothetical protein
MIIPGTEFVVLYSEDSGQLTAWDLADGKRLADQYIGTDCETVDQGSLEEKGSCSLVTLRYEDTDGGIASMYVHPSFTSEWEALTSFLAAPR